MGTQREITNLRQELSGVKTMENPKRRKIWRRTLILLGLVIVLLAGLSLLGTKIIYDSQFGRFEPPDPSLTSALHYQDLESGYPRELVSFYSGKNKLQGYLYPKKGSLGLVVVVHGLGGGADSYLPQIKYFLDQGWSVFAYDATGSYNSEGEGTRGFPQALVDLDAALSFIKSRKDLNNLPLLVFGHSWGGYAAANILHFDHELAGVVSISAPNSALEMILEQGSHMLGPVIYAQRPFLWFYQWLLYGKTASLTAVEALNKTSVPVLIVHGTADTVVDYYGSAIINKRMEITNPKVRFLALEEEGQNDHNNIFRSKEALAYITPLNQEYRAVFDQYEGKVPEEVRREFYARVDRRLANDINRGLMDEIHSFFLSCL